jgi:hypothetical protein
MYKLSILSPKVFFPKRKPRQEKAATDLILPKPQKLLNSAAFGFFPKAVLSQEQGY